MTGRTLTVADYHAVAEDSGVCVRPVIHEVTDTTTGAVALVPIRCGATRISVCRPCGEKARRLRMHQCREGWHRTTEPDVDDPAAPEHVDVTNPDDGDPDQADTRRVRSTRRRQDAPDLPRVPMSSQTTGRTFTTKTGITYRPSMFLTLTLPSYGRVLADGTPAVPARYDYRRAALDALHVGKLIDRFWQNMRRCAGYNLQYFAAIEPQRRLAPHMHAAVRGTLPRSIVRQVARATYTQIWWPSIETVRYPHDAAQPVWDAADLAYHDPESGDALTSWDEALDELGANPAAVPMHVVRFGAQIDMQGLLAGAPETERTIGYLTKYLGKDMAEDMTNDDSSARQREHAERLVAELRWLPCSPRCANWLRHGVQPRNPLPGMRAGCCANKAHDPDHLGYSGRRVLVSRKWTGKTLATHRADRAAVVRATLHAAGIRPDEHDTLSTHAPNPDTDSRFAWARIDPRSLDAPRYGRVIAASIQTAQRWRAEYQQACERAGPRSTATRHFPSDPYHERKVA